MMQIGATLIENTGTKNSKNLEAKRVMIQAIAVPDRVLLHSSVRKPSTVAGKFNVRACNSEATILSPATL